MTLEQEFVKFIEDVYPDAPEKDSDQYKQLRDAFFGGCLTAYTSKEDFSAELAAEYKRIKSQRL